MNLSQTICFKDKRSCIYTIMISALGLLGIIGCTSYKNSATKTDHLAIVQQYFQTMNATNAAAIDNWFGEQLTVIEGAHAQVYAKEAYKTFLQWDAVFDPTYKILNIAQQGDLVKATISKNDTRINFLHEAPFVTNQTFAFQHDKIIRITTEYIDFDVATWADNKQQLLDWIAQYHPDLNGFIHEQTEAGGIKFLKAITFYKDKK